MNIKKIAITTLLGMSVVGLTGCDVHRDKVNRAKAKMNTLEMVIYRNLDAYESTGMYSDILTTVSKRSEKLREDAAPFCDVSSAIFAVENLNTTKKLKDFTITRQTDNFVLCKKESEKLQYVNTKDENTVVVENGDTQEEILSPRIIDEITEASVECFSAKVKMVDIIDDKGYLTKQDYPEIIRLVSKCKMHKLRVEVESN